MNILQNKISRNLAFGLAIALLLVSVLIALVVLQVMPVGFVGMLAGMGMLALIISDLYRRR